MAELRNGSLKFILPGGAYEAMFSENYRFVIYLHTYILIAMADWGLLDSQGRNTQAFFKLFFYAMCSLLSFNVLISTLQRNGSSLKQDVCIFEDSFIWLMNNLHRKILGCIQTRTNKRAATVPSTVQSYQHICSLSWLQP